MRLVIDTNVFMQALSRKNQYHPILESIRYLMPHFLLVSNEIISEYYEIISRHFSEKALNRIEIFIENSIKIITVEPHYRFNLVSTDPDDNKFVDCAICSNADFLITSDKHFDILKSVQFPKVNIISPEEFIKEYLH